MIEFFLLNYLIEVGIFMPAGRQLTSLESIQPQYNFCTKTFHALTWTTARYSFICRVEWPDFPNFWHDTGFELRFSRL